MSVHYLPTPGSPQKVHPAPAPSVQGDPSSCAEGTFTLAWTWASTKLSRPFPQSPVQRAPRPQRAAWACVWVDSVHMCAYLHTALHGTLNTQQGTQCWPLPGLPEGGGERGGQETGPLSTLRPAPSLPLPALAASLGPWVSRPSGSWEGRSAFPAKRRQGWVAFLLAWQGSPSPQP